MDMLPPQAPPAIVSSVDQPQRGTLRRLAESQAWLHAQQDDLPDAYAAADEREEPFLQDIDAFWNTDTVDVPLPGQAGMSRRQALGSHLARAARDNATLLASRGLLSSTAVDLVRRATESDGATPPNIRFDELLIGQTPRAGAFVLQDDHEPGMVLLFGTRTGWEAFPSLDHLLCEVEERLQIHLFQADDDLSPEEVGTHFLRTRALDGKAFVAVADRLIAAYHESVARVWREDNLSLDWEDRLHETMQLSSIFDLYRLGALSSQADPISPTTPTTVLSRVRRMAPTGAGSGAVRRTGTARGVAEHLGPVSGAAQRMAGSVARHLGVGVPGRPAAMPATSTLPRPQEMFSRRYSAPEVTLPEGPSPVDRIYRLDGNNYVQRNGLPYRVRYDPMAGTWRLSSRGPTQGSNTGPIIDLGPDGQWEIQFPAPHETLSPSAPRTPANSPIQEGVGFPTGVPHPDRPRPSPGMPVGSPEVSVPATLAAPIDLPPEPLSSLPRILKDIMREELARQLDNSVVGALSLFRRVRRWHDGGDAGIPLTARDIEAWNAAMRSMRERIDDVLNPPSTGTPISTHPPGTPPRPDLSEEAILPLPSGDPSDNAGATLSELLVTHPTASAADSLTPETLDAWSSAANDFAAHPRLSASPIVQPAVSLAIPATLVAEPILNKPLPRYPFDHPGLNDRARMLDEMSRLMPSQADAELLLKRMQDSHLANEPMPQLSRREENAWRGAIAQVETVQHSKYRARRMDAVELPPVALASIRSRQNYFVKAGRTNTPFERLIYLRDKHGELIHLSATEQDEWRNLLEFVRKKRGPVAEIGLPAKRYRPELDDFAIADIRTIRRRLEKDLGKDVQEEIFKHKALDGPTTRPLTEAEERAWNETVAMVRERPSRFESDSPSEAIRDFSSDDMRELWRELRTRTRVRQAQDIYRTHAVKKAPGATQAPMDIAPQWQPAVDAVRQRRRAPPPVSMAVDEVARGLWYVPQEAWPTTLYHYVPAATLADATDHVVRIPITRLESLRAEGIPVFTAAPDTSVLSLPNRHTALLPDLAPGLAPDPLAPEGSIGARSGAWVQFNPAEVRESLETFVELYRVGGPTSTSFVLRPSPQGTAVGFTELWLSTPFVIHRPQP